MPARLLTLAGVVLVLLGFAALAEDRFGGLLVAGAGAALVVVAQLWREGPERSAAATATVAVDGVERRPTLLRPALRRWRVVAGAGVALAAGSLAFAVEGEDVAWPFVAAGVAATALAAGVLRRRHATTVALTGAALVVDGRPVPWPAISDLRLEGGRRLVVEAAGRHEVDLRPFAHEPERVRIELDRYVRDEAARHELGRHEETFAFALPAAIPASRRPSGAPGAG